MTNQVCGSLKKFVLGVLLGLCILGHNSKEIEDILPPDAQIENQRPHVVGNGLQPILIVHDNPVLLKMTAKIVKSIGYVNVFTVADGRTFLHMANKGHHYHLIIAESPLYYKSDLFWPSADDAIKEFRRYDKSTPILALANVHPKCECQCPKVNAVLIQPASRNLLGNTIGKLLTDRN